MIKEIAERYAVDLNWRGLPWVISLGDLEASVRLGAQPILVLTGKDKNPGPKRPAAWYILIYPESGGCGATRV